MIFKKFSNIRIEEAYSICQRTLTKAYITSQLLVRKWTFYPKDQEDSKELITSIQHCTASLSQKRRHGKKPKAIQIEKKGIKLPAFEGDIVVST